MGRPAKSKRTEFGERLVTARQQAGLSQAQGAEKLGITQQSYGGWERRETALKPEQTCVSTRRDSQRHGGEGSFAHQESRQRPPQPVGHGAVLKEHEAFNPLDPHPGQRRQSGGQRRAGLAGRA